MSKNFIKKKETLQFQKNGSEFIAHPIMNKSIGIETSNGSLGQGLSFGVGLAISYKRKKNKINPIKSKRAISLFTNETCCPKNERENRQYKI